MNLTNITTGSPDNSTDIYETINVGQETRAILVPLAWGIITVIGALGNAVVIYTLVRHGDRTATNYFIINLAITDLAFLLIVVPVTATLYALPYWIFGDAMCKITTYMIYVTLHATCFTLMAMSIDRYYVIVYAIQSRIWRTTTKSFVVCLAVWLVSALISLPYAIYFRVVLSTGYCWAVWPEPQDVYDKATSLTVVITSYVIPLSVILFCYANILNTIWKKNIASRASQQHSGGLSSLEKKRMRATKLVVSVVTIFATFWLPIHVINLCLTFNPNFPKTIELYNFKIFANTLSYANSCVNPFVYAFLGDGFRKSFRKTFPSLVQRYRMRRGSSD